MNVSVSILLRRFSISAFFAAALLGGCISEEAVRHDVDEAVEPLRKGPEKTAVVKNITNFAGSLRCMDNLMATYGVRDLLVISDDIEDKTGKVAAGAKDMLISAVSDMSRSSRAIRLIAWGRNEGSHLYNFMENAGNKGESFRLRPKFGIRGSISQYDENVAQKTAGGALSLAPFLDLGKTSTASASILGLDLTVIEIEDLTVVPGATSNNTVQIVRSESATEAAAEYSKFGINFEMSLQRSQGLSQALRSLVDLAAIELFGKLTMTPYWTCLGSTSDVPEIKAEIGDWFSNLVKDSNYYVSYWQGQMRLRGLYSGEINGSSNGALSEAVGIYGEVLGFGTYESSKRIQPDLNFFTAYLNADHNEIAPKAQALLASWQKKTPGSAVSVAAAPISLQIDDLRAAGGGYFRPGESIVLQVTPSRDAYVYCFMQDENNAIMRFFPNRFGGGDAFVTPRGMNLPGKGGFSIDANTRGSRETIACYATERDVFTALPENIAAGDFEALPVKGMAELSAAFLRFPNAAFAEFPIQVR
jgi:hypothetical protein